MAYDQHSVYQPPHRPYYSQDPAPPKPSYNRDFHQAYQPNAYTQDVQGHPNEQQFHQYYDGYGNTNIDGHGNNDYNSRSYAQQDVGYDPRHQTRPDVGRHNGYAHGTAVPQDQYAQRAREYGRETRPNQDRMPNGHHNDQPQQQMQQYASRAPNQRAQSQSRQPGPQAPYQDTQLNASVQSLPSVASAPVQSRGRAPPAARDAQPNGQPAQSGGRNQSRARGQSQPAKRRPLIEPPSPKLIAQDNAFPVFPTKKNKARSRANSQAREGGEAKAIEKGSRSSGEGTRPSTATDNRTGGRTESPPGSVQRSISRPPPVREVPSGAAAAVGVDSYRPCDEMRRPGGHEQPPRTQPAPIQVPRQQYGGVPMSPTRQNGYHQQEYVYEAQAVPDRQTNHGRPGAPQVPNPSVTGYEHDYGHSSRNNVPGPAAPTGHYPPPRPQGRGPPPAGRGRPQVPPIATGQPGPLRGEPDPMSPSRSPMRPPTTSTNRSSPHQLRSGLHNPQPGSSAYSDRSQPSKPWTATPGGHNSIADVFDDYYGYDVTDQPQYMDRDAQIEAEMPDFDNIPDSETAHKRSMTIDQHLASPARPEPPPPLPAMPNYQDQNPMPQASYPNKRFYQQEPHAASQPEFGGSKRGSGGNQGGITDGFVFGVPGETAQHAPVDHYPGPQQQQGLPYRQGPPPQGLPPHSARSDGRFPANAPQDPPPGPYSQRPMHPGQHPPQHGQPGQYRPQHLPQNGQQFHKPAPYTQGPGANRPSTAPQQPGFNRDPAGQPQCSNQGSGYRGPGAPLLRTGSEQPYRGPAMGAPLTQQRSAPQVQGQSRSASNPDALPQHPTPVRAGLMEQSTAPAAKPPPVRQYNTPPSTAPSVSSHQSRGSIDARRESQSLPVTHTELDQLRAKVNSNPNDYKSGLLLAKKLVEAASVLAGQDGRGDPKATAKSRENYIFDAHKRIKKLVHAGYPDAMFYLADCYGQGSLGLAVDTKEAFQLYQAAAKAGHAASAYRTAVCCEMGPEEGGGTRRDLQKAVQWYRRAAQLQDVAAMYKLGMILLKGLLGAQKNAPEALTWLKRAAERADFDNPHALHELGLLYEPGGEARKDPSVRDKVIPDEKYARELFDKAAGLGYKFSQFRLGQAYEYGNLGCPIDARNSIAWYCKAAAQGEHGAELALSGWYLTGAEGILQPSDTEAYLWARKAATSSTSSNPNPKAMFAMGYYTETGIGCPASLEEAKKWYGRAAAYRFPKAVERLEEMKRGGGNRGEGKRAGKEKVREGRLAKRGSRDDCVIM